MKNKVFATTDRKTTPQLVTEFESLIKDMEKRAHHVGNNEINSPDKDDIENIGYLNKLKYHIKKMKNMRNILSSRKEGDLDDILESEARMIFKEAKILYNEPVPEDK